MGWPGAFLCDITTTDRMKKMGVYLSRKYHYLLKTEKALKLSAAERLAAANEITKSENTLETDLPEWVQNLNQGNAIRPPKRSGAIRNIKVSRLERELAG